MAFINHAAREIHCKIVYSGPTLAGKTTNIFSIFQKTAVQARGNMITLTNEPERTVYFDFLPLSFGTVRGFCTRFHLYSLPGQVLYERGQRLILRGVDGVIFVADSQIHRIEANEESMEALKLTLRSEGILLSSLPWVLQCNKRDLDNIAPISELKRILVEKDTPCYEAIAVKGIGVFDPLKETARRILSRLKNESEKTVQL